MKITALEKNTRIELKTVETGVILTAGKQAIVLGAKELHLAFAALAVYFDSKNEPIETVLNDSDFQIKISR